MKRLNLLVLAFIAMVIVGCQPQLSADEQVDVDSVADEKITVVTTLFPLYEFAKEVGGDTVDVSLLLPAGVEPHAFSPKPSDMKKISEADVFLYIGEIMEPWAHDILEGTSNENLRIVDASSLVALLESNHHHDHAHEEDEHHIDEHHDEHADEQYNESETHALEVADDHHDEEIDEHDHGEYDPHIWLDLSNNQAIVSELAHVYSELQPNNSEIFEQNAQEYNQRLQTLDDAYFTALELCAHDEFIVGGHNFFGYIEKRYDISGISAIENLAPNTEPTPRRIQELTELANEHNVSYILTEVLVSTQMADAIANEVGAEVLIFQPGANIRKDDFDAGVTFLSIMEENLDTLKIALECN